MAVSRLDGRGLRCPEPVPRIAVPSHPVTRALRTSWARSAGGRGTLSPRFGGSQAATLTRIAAGVFTPSVYGWPHRWPPTFAVPAFEFALHGLRVRKSDFYVRSVFLFRRSLPCPTTWGNISRQTKKSENYRQLKITYPPERANALGTSEIAVHKPVDNLIHMPRKRKRLIRYHGCNSLIGRRKSF